METNEQPNIKTLTRTEVVEALNDLRKGFQHQLAEAEYDYGEQVSRIKNEYQSAVETLLAENPLPPLSDNERAALDSGLAEIFKEHNRGLSELVDTLVS